MNAEEYRREQEKFVSGLEGGSILDVLLVLVHTPLLVAISSLLPSSFSQSPFLRDFVLIVAPLVLTTTCLHDLNPVILMVELLALCILRMQLSTGAGRLQKRDAGRSEGGTTSLLSSHAVTHFKGAIVLLTCIVILAVDFPVFPRNFAKTETFGISLMDLGTGAFIFSSALTSRFVRGLPANALWSALFSWRRTAVLALAVGRTIAIKALHYQEHVSEYGLHWNFFLTLYMVWTLAELLHSLLPRYLLGWLAALVLAGYQWQLQHGWADFLLSEQRNADNLVEANKEGLYSLLGYLALFLLAEAVSFWLSSLEHRKQQIGWVAVASAAWLSWWLAASKIQVSSRRLCNVSYVLLVLAVCWTLLLCFQATELLGLVNKDIPILSAYCHGSLPVFLFANLLTGAINMSMRTLFAPSLQAVLLISIYSFVISGVACLLHHRRVGGSSNSS